MKRLFLVITILSAISFKAICQDMLTFTEVVKVDSTISKNELFNRAELWMANAYKNAQKVIQVKDKENGQIMGKAVLMYDPNVFSGSDLTRGSISYTISIYVKDGRYKYEISNFYHDPFEKTTRRQSMGAITTSEEYQGEGTAMFPKSWKTKVWKDIKSQINADLERLIPDLKQGMAKRIESNNENW